MLHDHETQLCCLLTARIMEEISSISLTLGSRSDSLTSRLGFSEQKLRGAKTAEPHYVALGVVLGVLILSKVVYMPVVLSSAAALVWFKRNSLEAKVVVIRTMAMVLIAGAIVAPW